MVMTNLLERKKEIEDRVIQVIDPLTEAEKWIAYSYLHHLGHSMNSIECRIDDAVKRDLSNNESR